MKKIIAFLILATGIVSAQQNSPFAPPTFIGTSPPLLCSNGSLFYNVNTSTWSTCWPNNQWVTSSFGNGLVTQLSQGGLTFQSLVPNDFTYLKVVPNGTNVNSRVEIYNSSDLTFTNTGKFRMSITNNGAGLQSELAGSGSGIVNQYFGENNTAATLTSINWQFNGVTKASLINTGLWTPTLYGSATNCSSAASPAVCASAPDGSVVIAAAATTIVVDTSAVTANSQILVQWDSSLGTKLSVTCNTTPTIWAVTARSAGVSFTITTSAPTTNPACFSYSIIN